MSRLPIALPFADKLFPAATFDMRKALAIHAKGITHVMQNTGHLSAKDRAYMMTAELVPDAAHLPLVLQVQTIASARMMARHQTPHEQLVNSVSEPTRKAYGAHPGPLRRQSPTGCSMTAPSPTAWATPSRCGMNAASRPSTTLWRASSPAKPGP